MDKEPAWSKEDSKLHARIHRICKSNDAKCSMIATLLGSAGVLLQLIHDEIPMKKLDDYQAYACALIAANLMTFTADSNNVNVIHFPLEHYEVSEQTQENVFRRMCLVVKDLSKRIDEIEDENKVVLQ